MFCLLIITVIISIFIEENEFSPIFILIIMGQMILFRYFFIVLSFKFISKESLKRLRDVLDFEFIKS